MGQRFLTNSLALTTPLTASIHGMRFQLPESLMVGKGSMTMNGICEVHLDIFEDEPVPD